MNYKNYQKVLDFAPNKKTAGGYRHLRPAKSAPKRRTKTGCLTCRSRKKKCDEETEGGKCQACIRNFLDCSWPEKTSVKLPASSAPTHPEALQPKAAETPVPHPAPSQLLATPQIESQRLRQLHMPILPKFREKISHGASAYPSPVASPQFPPVEQEDSHGCGDHETMQAITLPPIRTPAQKPLIEHSRQPAKFIVTSFDRDRALLHIKS